MPRFIVLLLAVLALATGPGRAQRQLPPPLPGSALSPGRVRIARVVDARFERLGTGSYAPTGTLPPAPAVFDAPLPQVLQAYFGAVAPGQPEATPLLLRVTGFDVAEPRSATASAGLVADLYAPQPDSSYRLLRHLALYSEQGVGIGRPPHAANLGQLLLGVVLAARDEAGWLPAPGPRQPAAYVLAAEPHAAEQLPVLDPARPRRPGYYHSLSEFWENNPSEPGSPDFDSRPYVGTEWAGELEVKAYRRTADGRRTPATDVWGMCDGEHVYVRRGNAFCRLQPAGNHFVFTGRVGEGAVLHAAHNALGMASLVYLGVGGLSLESEHPVRMSLHPLTGTVQALELPGAAPAPLASRPTQLYIYRPRAARGPAVQVQVPGTEPARELPAGDYLSFQVAGGQPLQVCLQPASGPEYCQSVTPTPELTTYLEYQPGQAEPLRLVPAKAGASAVERLAR